MDPDIGIAKKARLDVAEALGQVLADTYALYAKTHAYHWNVTGPRFNTLHQMFMTQYTALWTALDEIAERIRALGVMAPGPDAVAKRAKIQADNGEASAEQMVLNLLKGHETLVKSARDALAKAEEASDDASADLMTQRIAFSEKTAWMLRATAES